MLKQSIVVAAALAVMLGCERETRPGEDASSSEGVITIRDVDLNYVIEGRGTPLLVIGSATYYPRTFSQRLRNHFQFHFVDLRHFAPSAPTMQVDAITLDSYAEDVDVIRRFFGFDEVAVLGHSIHGNMALEYARRYPQRVSHVVVIGSPPVGLLEMSEVGAEYWDSHASAERKQVLQDNWDRLGEDSLAKLPPGDVFVVSYITNGPLYWYDATYDATPLWEGMYVNADVWNRIFELYSEYDLSVGPGQITSPIFLAMGPYDYVVPHILWDDQLEKLESVSYHLFERSGHTPQLEEQDLFDEKLIEWFEGK